MANGAPRGKQKKDEPTPLNELDALIVLRTESENGDIKWQVTDVLGNLKADQVVTGLKLASNEFEQRIGTAGS
jgi:hypothetical protein